MTNLLRAITSLSTVTAVLCLQAGHAQATAYGFAINQVTDLQILIDSGSITLNSGVDRTNTNQTTFNNAVGPSSDQSTTTLAPNPTDTLEAYTGPNANVVPQNDYTLKAGQAAGLVGARADGNTGFGNPFVANGGTLVSGGTGTSVMNTVAEALTNPSDVATSDARSTNVGQFIVGAGGATLHVAFNDNTALYATTTNPGEVSQVTLGNDFEFDGPTQFAYVPAAINLTESSIDGANAISFNPTNIAYTSPEMTLLPGLYNFSRRNEAQVNLQAAAPVNVSEPRSVAMLGLALVGLGLIRNRSR